MFQTPLYQNVVKISKPVLILVLTVFIFFKLFYFYHIDTLFQNYAWKPGFCSFCYLGLAIVLMFFNWGIESLKWKWLIQRFEPISFNTSLKAILSGVSLSIITPNQIGDFMGRVIHLEVMNKIKGSLVTVIGHTAQVIITVFFGLFTLAFFSVKFVGIGYWIPFGFLFILILIWVYLKMDLVYKYISHWKWILPIAKYVDVFGAYQRKDLIQILGLSFLRYLVFLTQYYLLLRFYQVDIHLFPALACIIATFCVQSIVPSFLLLEIGLRGASALYFFTIFSSNQEGILLAAYSLWIVNMLIPAILGMYFIYRVKS